MRTIFPTLIAVVFAGSSCSTVREHSEHSDAEAIRAIYEQDRVAFSAAFQKAPARGKQYSDAIAQYTTKVRSIDMSRTPNAFQVAYLEHIQAWEHLSFEITNQPRDDAAFLAFITQLIASQPAPASGAGGSAAEAVQKDPATRAAETALLNARRKIGTTWDAVEVAALKSGVRLRSASEQQQR